MTSFEVSDDYERGRLELARTYIDDEASLQRALEHATSISAQTIDVRRVGIWVFEHVGAILRCRTLYDRATDRHTAGEVLVPARYPTYLRAVEERREVVADDAWTHPYTRELAESYLKPMGITSLLDAPVYRKGIVVGVVCHEHVGPARQWTSQERSMAACMADIVALLLEQSYRLKAEAALRRSEEQRRDLYKLEALGDFSARAAHDFGNLLAVLVSGIAWLKQRGARDRDEEENLVMLEGAVERARDLSRQLLEFGRQAQGERRRTNLNDLCRAARALLVFHAGDRCNLEYDLSETPLVVDVDPMHVDRVLLNLVTNARDAMPLGGTIRVRTRIGTKGEIRRAMLEVSDTGIGMEPETARHIFEPYFTTKGASGGTGLGLASVYGLVQQSGGSVEVRSTPGAGTTFTIWLPLAGSLATRQ